MTSESLKFVDTSGYGTSGKSAVIELLQEFDGYYAASRDCEFELLRIHDGLIDLENALVHSWSPVRGSMALVKFEILVKNLGANPSLLNLFGQYNSYATKYDSRFNGKFVDLSMEYISNLTHVSYKSYLPHEYLLRSKLKYFFERLLIKSGIKNNALKECLFLTVAPDLFYKETKDYLNNLFNIFNETYDPDGNCPSVSKHSRYQTFVISNAIEPYNPYGSLNLFHNCKQIVVDRDPRDIYLSLQQPDTHAGWGHTGMHGEDDLNTFINRYRFLRQRTASFDPNESHHRIKIQFEDLVLNYDATVSRIINFLQEEPEIHSYPKRYFNPRDSSKVIGLWKDTEFTSEVEYIYSQLEEYCIDI